MISDGSTVIVADGQCLLIVDQGKVMDVCAEPGVYTYKTGTTPSVFAGNLKDGLKGVALDAWNRFQFGGGTGKDQRVYYVNTKEIYGNKYGTLNPVPFKVVIDKNIGKTLSIGVRCNGEYAYKIINPMLATGNLAQAQQMQKPQMQQPQMNNGAWYCSACGTANNGRFCENCGTPRN